MDMLTLASIVLLVLALVGFIGVKLGDLWTDEDERNYQKDLQKKASKKNNFKNQHQN